LNSHVGKGHMTVAQTYFLGECSGTQFEVDGDVGVVQQKELHPSVTVGPHSPCLVDFPPLRKSNSYGPGPILTPKNSKEVGNKSNKNGPCATTSDTVLFTKKVVAAPTGVPLANSHIRFKDDSDCSDLSDSIEVFADEEERMLKLKKKLRLRNQSKGSKGKKGALINTGFTPPSGIDLLTQDNLEVVPETQGSDVNVEVLAQSKLEGIKYQVGFSFSHKMGNLVDKESYKVDP
jgi:hypothetical protein